MLLWATSTRAHFSVGDPVTDSERSGEEQTNLMSMNSNHLGQKQEWVGGCMCISIIINKHNLNSTDLCTLNTDLITLT